MHRFIVKGIWKSGDEVTLSAEEGAHAVRVLRLKPGDRVAVLTGEAAFDARLNEVSRARVTAILGAPEDGRVADVRLTVYQGLAKSDKLDFIVQKLAELGAFACQPVAMARSVVRADADDAAKKTERLERIATEAAKQCGCARVLRVAPPSSYEAALVRLRAHSLALMPWEDARLEAPRLRALYALHPEVKDIALVIGPEGGLEAREAEAARAAGALFVSLGPRILRTETAAVAASAIAMSLWGDI